MEFLMSTTPAFPPLHATLDHLALASPSPDRLSSFYATAMGLNIRPEGEGWWGEAADRRLHFVQGEAGALLYAAYRVSGQEQLDMLAGRLAAAGWPEQDSPSPRFDRSICLDDPDGNRLVFGLPAPVAGEPEAVGAVVPPARLQHIVMGSRDAARLATFYQDVLGFVLSDVVTDDAGVVRTSFMRCSDEHHSFAVFQTLENRLDHHCYETSAWDQIRDWGDRMALHHIPVKWGPGRHGPGNNLFLFVHDVDGNWIEISAELEIVETDRPAGTWPHSERTLNTWGSAPLRS
jgi:catechol 2,3-dioxygenase